MKKVLSGLLLMVSATVFAQPEGRVFTITTQAYTNLALPTILTTQGWDDFDASVPLGFNFSMMGKTTSTLYFDSDYNEGADVFMAPLTSITHGMSFGVDLIDRSTITGNPPSTVGYKIDVVSGKKIAKIEWRNVGYYYEMDGNNTLNDSASFQLWVYEGSNDVEVRWGPHRMISDPEDIFDFGLPFFSFVRNVDATSFNFDYFFYVSGTTPPKVDSIDVNGLMALTSSIGIPSYPPNGTVYKFAKPVVQGINNVKLNGYTSVYPTIATTECTIDINLSSFAGDINLIDMNGKIALTQKGNAGKNILNFSSLAPGNYILNIKSTEESVFYKISKQ